MSKIGRETPNTTVVASSRTTIFSGLACRRSWMTRNGSGWLGRLFTQVT